MFRASVRFFLVMFSAALLLSTSYAQIAYAGRMVHAKCACGYEEEKLFLFGGKDNFMTVCMFPAHCAVKKELVMVNLRDMKKSASDCPLDRLVLYNDPSLREGEPGEEIASWNLESLNEPLVLYDNAYLCPRCGTFRLKFDMMGFWD